MKRLYIVLALAIGLLHSVPTYGQNVYLATNLADYLNLGTINGEFGLSPRLNWSFYLKARYNPFTFKVPEQIQNRVASGAVGARYWPWYAGCGWFVNSHVGYSKYNTGGIIDSYAYEGDAFHLTFGGGYALMVGKNMNIDFGIGVQGGITSYIKYACPKCGKVVGRQKEIYFIPSNLMVQLTMIL